MKHGYAWGLRPAWSANPGRNAICVGTDIRPATQPAGMSRNPMDTKILDLGPDDERALLRAAEIAAGEGRFADARAYFTAGVDLLLARGDVSGADAFRARLDRLALVDVERHLDVARNRSGAGVTYREAPARRAPAAPP